MTSLPVAADGSSWTSTASREHNNENITLIWLNSKIETKQMAAMDELREVNDYVKFYSDREECINYIISINDESVLLVIMCEACACTDLQAFQTLRAVNFIFIFCSDHHQSEVNNSKVIGVFCEQYELINSIRKTIKLVENQMQTFSLYNQDREKSIRDLTKESAQFLWLHMFKDIILQMPRDANAKQQLVDFCRSYYHGNKVQLESIANFERTYPDTSNAIQWYTKQSFIYKIVNKALRCENIELLHIFRFFISDLSLSLATEHQKQTIDKVLTQTFYRGCQLSKDDFERIQQNIGNLISVNGFLSTSRSKDVALIYAGTSNADAYYPILLEIEYNFNDSTHSIVYADISTLSCFPDEAEILFDFGTTFQIVSLEEEKNFNIWILKMKAVDEGTHLTKEYVELNRRENHTTDINILFGNLLRDMGKIDQAQKYFENILSNDSQKEQVDRAGISNSLGTLYYLKGESDKAYQSYGDAYDRMIHSNPSRIRDSAAPLNNLGIVMFSRRNFHQAREYYFKSLAIDKEFFGEECLKVANTLLNISLTYEEEKDYQNSLDYCKQALAIQREVLPKNHVNIATSLNTIGTIYQRMNDLDGALDYYQQAYEMRVKILPEEHDDIGESFHNLGEIFDQRKQHDQALEYYLKSVEIREKIYRSSNGHVTLALTLYYIGRIYEHRNTNVLALDYYQRAWEMYQRFSITSDNDPDISELNDSLVRLSQQMNE